MDSYDENRPSKRRRQRSRSGERTGQMDRQYRNERQQRSESNSPDRSSRRREHEHQRQHSRSRSPSASHHHHRSHHHRHHSTRSPTRGSQRAIALPFSARQLSKSEFETFRPLFAQYLELQKNKRIEDLDDHEIRGRWKSFVNKWNDGVLAEGWYDPEHFTQVMRRNADHRQEDVEAPLPLSQPRSVSKSPEMSARPVQDQQDENDEDDDYGPRLPGAASHSRHGPGVPNLQDIQVQREAAEEDRLERAEQLRLERKADRKEQKARLEELVPRAEAGTRERQLEKKKEVNEKMKAFRERSPGAPEIKDSELMGGGDGVEDYKRMKASAARRKTEREIRKEEIARAKAEEREERLREYREKEDHAMAMLKELARQRFG